MTEEYHRLDKEIALVNLTHTKDIQNIETARTLQATEYSRRLEILNHEAQQLKDMQSRYLPREVYEGTLAELRKEIEELKEYKDTGRGKQSVVTVVVATLISFGFLLLNFFIK